MLAYITKPLSNLKVDDKKEEKKINEIIDYLQKLEKRLQQIEDRINYLQIYKQDKDES